MDTPADRHIDGAISQELLKQLAYNEKMSELGRISAGVVHELNAPLSVIISASQMIMREADVPEFVREMVARISSEAMRLSQMTRGLLNFSSQEETDSGGVADINLTVGFVLDFLGYEAARRGVTLLRKLDYHLPVVKVGANLLKQVLLNIIMNALQAMENGGGSLMVETMAPEAGKVSIVIVDTGPGIPAASLTRIFEPYFTTKKPGEGTGLGLFVTKRLVENLGGSIEVRSTEGEGTTFVVTFSVDEE
ncbi:MAG TPA: HAMP domain-containing sensor histidine kinase [Geobacteraceae bacterium]|nr:HAMP domain-containing sensor histidine kinase [Geobacteraceae bacterium]